MVTATCGQLLAPGAKLRETLVKGLGDTETVHLERRLS